MCGSVLCVFFLFWFRKRDIECMDPATRQGDAMLRDEDLAALYSATKFESVYENQ